MGKEAKTNAMRILERPRWPYTAHEYPHEEGVAVDGVTVAASMGGRPRLRLQDAGDAGGQQELLRLRHPGGSRAGSESRRPQCGRKKRCHDPCGRYQQGHRLCPGRLQPGGHEKAVHYRLRRERAEPAEGLRLRRAHRHARCAAPRPTSSRQPAPQRHTSFSKDLTIIYRSNKSYLKRKTECRNCTKF